MDLKHIVPTTYSSDLQEISLELLEDNFTKVFVPPSTEYVVIEEDGSIFMYNHKPLLSCGYYQPQPFHSSPKEFGFIEGYSKLKKDSETIFEITG